MKIKTISCEQFAGMREMSVSLSDGVNIIYGKNESGKSTLVNLLSRTLFQNERLDGRRDRDFIAAFFPSTKKGGVEIRSIDGEVSFETDEGLFTLKKEWGEGHGVRLSSPDGVIKDQDRVQEILNKVLLFGEGVYVNMLFSSQRGADESLRQALDHMQGDFKREIALVLTQAYLQSDGITTEALGAAIEKKIKELGNFWDENSDAPVKKQGGAGRREKEVGAVLKSFYNLEDKRAVIEKIASLESDLDRELKSYNLRLEEYQRANELFEKFNKYAEKLRERKLHEDRARLLGEKAARYLDDLQNWTKYEDGLQKARILHRERQQRELLDKYTLAKPIYDEWTHLRLKRAEISRPAKEEIFAAKSAQRKISDLQSKLCGMNVAAQLKMSGGHEAKIRSLKTGEEISISHGNATLSEAAEICIPGVMEMKLFPADVDVSLIDEKTKEQREILSAVLQSFGVQSVEELEGLDERCENLEREISRLGAKVSLLLGETPFEELEKDAAAIVGNVRAKEEIAKEVSMLCGKEELISYIAGKDAIVQGYYREYQNISSLKESLARAQAEEAAARAPLKFDAVPPEFSNISDGERYLQERKAELSFRRAALEEAIKSRSAAQSVLDRYTEELHFDPYEELDRATRQFQEQKSELKHWRHIQETFERLKKQMSSSPMQGLAESFSKYLNIITGGKVTSVFSSLEKLDVDVLSDGRPLNFDTLSEGTKETVSLAYRLAVLDHLFPEGGGVIVFDDPFANMDEARMQKSAALIEECARRHQVIFLTCKQDYKTLLSGNEINL